MEQMLPFRPRQHEWHGNDVMVSDSAVRAGILWEREQKRLGDTKGKKKI